MAEIPQECNFLTWSIQKYVKKTETVFWNILYYLISHTVGCFQHCTVNGVILHLPAVF